MRAHLRLVLLAAATLAAAPAALAADPAAPPLAPTPAERSAAVQDDLTVVPRADWRLRAPPAESADAVQIGGPDPRAPAPCGACRWGYDACGRPRWGGSLWLAFWLWGQDGEIGAQGTTSDVDTSLSDALDLFRQYGDAAFTGGARLDYGRAFARTWVSYIHLSGAEDVEGTGEPVEGSVEGLTAEVAAGYRVTEVALGCAPCSPCLAVEPWVGARYTRMKVSIDAPGFSDDSEKSWWDPIVGSTFRLDFRNGWLVEVEGSVGGFGLNSDLTWGVRADVVYMFTRHVGVFAGIAAIGWEHEDGGFTYDLTQWGPYGGVVFAF